MARRGLSVTRLTTTALTVCGGATIVTLAFLLAGMPGSDTRVQAQGGATSLGYGSCAGAECHARSGEIGWLTGQDGGKEHNASLRSLRNTSDKSMKYAKAVGLASFEDPAGMCLACHATFIARARMYEGIGCEGCHGPASGYRQFHSLNEKDYDGAVKLGLRNLKGRPVAWIPVCKTCHVLDKRPEYAALLDAGHPAGDRWNVTAKYVNIQTHWKRVKYTPAMITDAAGGRAITVPVVTPAPPIASAPTPSGTPAPAAPAAPVAPSTPAPVDKAAGTLPRTTAAGPAAVTPPAPSNAAAFAPAGAPLSITAPPPASPAGLLAALQDRVEALLASLLGRNAVLATPLKPLGPPPQVSGPDAELLRLQYEALGLAVEALNLRVKTAAPGPPK